MEALVAWLDDFFRTNPGAAVVLIVVGLVLTVWAESRQKRPKASRSIDPRPKCPECGAKLARPVECDNCGQLQDVAAVIAETEANLMNAELARARAGGFIVQTE